MIADGIAVTNYLRERFGKEKVYIMGHSWGTVLGILTVQKAPELFHAYMGIGQVARQAESERLAYKYMLEEFRRRNDAGMVGKLEKFPIDNGAPIDMQYLNVRSQGMMKLGIGVTHTMKSMKECVKIVLGYKGYTWKEKIEFAMGGNFSLNCLWHEVRDNDFCKIVSSLDIPVGRRRW